MVMSIHHSFRRPDFFAILLVLVVIGFGMTLAVQITIADRAQVVETEVVPQKPHAG